MSAQPGSSLRILYVVSQWGAPTQTFVRREADAARSAGHEVVVLSLKAPPAASTRDIPVTHLRASLPLLALWTVVRHPIRTARVITRSVLASRPSTVIANLASVAVGLGAAARLPTIDWIHAHFAWAAAGAADAIAEVRRQCYSVFPHAFDIFDDRFVDHYTTMKLRRAAFVVVESPSIQDEVNQRFDCAATVARMGVPPALVLSRAVDRRPERGRVVSVGSLLPKKGHDVLLRALAMLPEDVHLMIIGEGPERVGLEQFARDLGVEGRVRLVGALAETDVILNLDEAQVFCLASRPTPHGDRDGVPNVLIEAMARGVPCVSTTVSGIPDLLGAGRGLLARPDDPAGLADALRQVLDHPDEASTMAAAALAHIDAEYRTDRNWLLLEERIRVHMTQGSPTGARPR